MTINLKRKGYGAKEISQQLNIPLKIVYKMAESREQK